MNKMNPKKKDLNNILGFTKKDKIVLIGYNRIIAIKKNTKKNHKKLVRLASRLNSLMTCYGICEKFRVQFYSKPSKLYATATLMSFYNGKKKAGKPRSTFSCHVNIVNTGDICCKDEKYRKNVKDFGNGKKNIAEGVTVVKRIDNDPTINKKKLLKKAIKMAKKKHMKVFDKKNINLNNEGFED